MSDTPHLGLPMLEASQSQKHVTHNEALMMLDAVVQLSVKDRTRTSPPASPADGDRHIIATGATGAWSGKDNQIAHLMDGAWSFLAPESGWLCWDDGAGVFVAWDGSAWALVETGASQEAEFQRLGVNTAPDATNKLSVKSNAVLFAPVDASAGGNGDVRFTVNKETVGDTASLLFQSAWSGRAEVGLAGDDSLRAKVSDDGTNWSDVLVAEPSTGGLTVPNGLTVSAINAGPLAGFRNYLINGDFGINQRDFAGGALSAGSYGHDRWKADTGGANLSVSGDTVTLTSGTIVQVIESPGLGGATVTVSVEDPSGSITVDVEGQTDTITSGSGRRGITLTVPSGSTGDVTVKLSATSVDFKRIQLERGTVATPFEFRPAAIEQALCQRYFQVVTVYQYHGLFATAFSGGAWKTSPQPFPVTMRNSPSGVIVAGFGEVRKAKDGALGTNFVNDQCGATTDWWYTSGTLGGFGYGEAGTARNAVERAIFQFDAEL